MKSYLDKIAFLYLVNDFENPISAIDTAKSNAIDLIFLDDLVFHTGNKNIMSYQTLKSLAKSLDNSIFMRVHRSYIINRNKVTSLIGRDLLLANTKIAVSDSYYENVKRELF